MGERRKQEIEEKKARLAELRRARAERQKLLAQAEAGPSDVSVVAAGISDDPHPPLAGAREDTLC